MKRDQIVKGEGGILIRTLEAIKTFKVKFNHWPTILKMSKESINPLKEHHLTQSGFDILSSKIKIIEIADEKIIAEDDQGNQIDYGTEGWENTDSKEHPDLWIWGIELYSEI